MLPVPVAPGQLVFRDRVSWDEIFSGEGDPEAPAVTSVVLDRCVGTLANDADVGVLVPSDGFVDEPAPEATGTPALDVGEAAVTLNVTPLASATDGLAGTPVRLEADLGLRSGATGWWVPKATAAATDRGANCGESVGTTAAALVAGGAGAVAVPYTVQRWPTALSYTVLVLGSAVVAALAALAGFGASRELRSPREPEAAVVTEKDVEKDVEGTRIIAAVAGGSTSLVALASVVSGLTPGLQIAGLLVVGAVAAALVGLGGAIQRSAADLFPAGGQTDKDRTLTGLLRSGGAAVAAMGLAIAAMTNPFLLLHSQIEHPIVRDLLLGVPLVLVGVLVFVSLFTITPSRKTAPAKPAPVVAAPVAKGAVGTARDDEARPDGR